MNKRLENAIRIIIYMLFDIFAIVSSYTIAYATFKFFPDFNHTINFGNVAKALPFISLATVLIFYILKIYNAVIKHIGFIEITKLILSIVSINVVVVMILVFMQLVDKNNLLFMYKSGFFIITTLQVFLITGSRLFTRIIQTFKDARVITKTGPRYLVIGAGVAGRIAYEEINRSNSNAYVAGFVDDDELLHNKYIGAAKILGPISEIEKYIIDYNISDVILAIKTYSRSNTTKLLNQVAVMGVNLKKLNLIEDVDTVDLMPRIQKVNIEDLLDRSAINLNAKEISETIKDKVVLVTGGGGSIGSELCRQIFSFYPKEIIIFDIYENNAYDIQMELERAKYKNIKYENIKITTLIGSVYNKIRLENVFKKYKPNIVYHAAAYKHVPLMEDSPMEAIRTNVIGTYNCASLAKKYGSEKFVMVSSDKAVRPTNVMGATKRFAEMIIQSFNEKNKTVFAAVRFGNVLGSNGSVVPLFTKQIEDGGPVTVTHPEITRYFMTIPEAVGLILQCGYYAKGNEVFVLDMGSPVKIYDLAKKMIHLSGFKPEVDIKIEFTGLRSGEKMFKELLIDTSHADYSKTANKKIFVEKQTNIILEELKINYIIDEINNLDVDDSKELLKEVVNTYQTN